LFYKAAILAKQPGESISSLGHKISKLKHRYSELYPEVESMFRSPFDLTISEIARAFDSSREPTLEDFQEQFYRYMSDKQGNGPSGIHILTPRAWLKWIAERESHWKEIWHKVQDHTKGTS
jgi:hypothetical protein